MADCIPLMEDMVCFLFLRNESRVLDTFSHFIEPFIEKSKKNYKNLLTKSNLEAIIIKYAAQRGLKSRKATIFGE